VSLSAHRGAAGQQSGQQTNNGTITSRYYRHRCSSSNTPECGGVRGGLHRGRDHRVQPAGARRGDGPAPLDHRQESRPCRSGMVSATVP